MTNADRRMESLPERMRRKWMGDPRADAANLVMPFGKHVDRTLSQISLRYLDETVSTMEPRWFVRRVRELVDWAMLHPACMNETRVPELCVSDLCKQEFSTEEDRYDGFD